MKHYIGTKIVQAKPMARGVYNAYRGWVPPEGEDQSVDGYLVEYLDGGASNHPDHDGYISWSPKDVFEKSYKGGNPGELMDFPMALTYLKRGSRIARSGWNGKGMWLAYSPGVAHLESTKFWAVQNRKFAQNIGGYADVLPCITMKTADDKILMGWLASQTDMLAEDWMVLTS